METTTNYGFKTYQSGDLFNPLTTDNYNMEKLDTELKAVDDRTIGRATELVSGGVHAITLLDTDCKTFKFTATGNYDALETFTLNGISVNAYLPDGSSLQADAYKTGAIVMCSRNSDDSALTFYLSSVGGIAPDSEKLGGELPTYYATKSYADGIKTTADTASVQIQKKALVNTYYDTSVKKLYIVNADGTKGSEIDMGGTIYSNAKYAVAHLGYNMAGNLVSTDLLNETCYVGTGDTAGSTSFCAQLDSEYITATGNQYLITFTVKKACKFYNQFNALEYLSANSVISIGYGANRVSGVFIFE